MIQEKTIGKNLYQCSTWIKTNEQKSQCALTKLKGNIMKVLKKNATRHKAKFHNGFIIDVFFLQITQCVLSRGVFLLYLLRALSHCFVNT